MNYGRRRPPRLSDERYVGQRTISFTANLVRRRRFFVEHCGVGPHVEILRRLADEHECTIPIYCFMPDHLHFLTMGKNERANGRRAMDKFKLESALWFEINGLPGWQDSYHDHAIRSADDWRNHATYIAMNPVRAGLVENCFDYPFLGTFGHDLADVVLGWD